MTGMTYPPIPNLHVWEQNMLAFGVLHGDLTKDYPVVWEGWPYYYDGMWAFYQIADYTGDDKWIASAKHVMAVYKEYVLAAGGCAPGWRVFPHGVYEDYIRTGDEDSQRVLCLLADGSAFSSVGGAAPFTRSRETAYILQAYMYAARLDELPARAGRQWRIPHPKLQQALEFALGHMEQWFVSKTVGYMQPAMVGLTAHALIEYDQVYGDARIQPLLERAADWLWRHAWVRADQSFYYQSNIGGTRCTAYDAALGARSEGYLKLADIQAPGEWFEFTPGMTLQTQKGWSGVVIPKTSEEWRGTVDVEVRSGILTAGDVISDAAGTMTAVFENTGRLDDRHKGAPDLNMLIAPLYAWLFKQTKSRKYLFRGDAIFAGGAARAYLWGGKHFTQNYRLSFSYVQWRTLAVDLRRLTHRVRPIFSWRRPKTHVFTAVVWVRNRSADRSIRIDEATLSLVSDDSEWIRLARQPIGIELAPGESRRIVIRDRSLSSDVDVTRFRAIVAVKTSLGVATVKKEL